MFPYSFAQTAKTWAALIGAVATAALAYVDPSWEVGGYNVGASLGWVAAAATAVVTFLTKNAPAADAVAPPAGEVQGTH